MNKQEELKQEFTSIIKGVNYLTPVVLEFFKIKGGVCELSTNKAQNIYGVTVIVNNNRANDLSKSFDSYSESLNYIKKLKK